MEVMNDQRIGKRTILCESTDCKYLDRDKTCTAGFVHFGYDECYTFKNVNTTKDFQTEYWIACGNKEKRYKSKRYGKEVHIKGLTFYTRDNIDLAHLIGEQNIFLTEKETGCRLTLQQAKNLTDEQIKTIITFGKKHPAKDLEEGKEHDSF